MNLSSHQPPPRGENSAILLAFAGTVFLSAFLLFQVQPLASKFILPWFGGSPAVWTAAMLFFQVVLFGGYLYAHLTSTWCSPRGQFLAHCGLLAAGLLAVALTRITPPEALRPSGEAQESPLASVLLLLLFTVGLPYFCLSATGPLLQKWFSDSFPGTSPYRLFALSNVGSLLALVSYPLAFEAWWGVHTQAGMWCGGFVLFVAVCLVAARFTLRMRLGHAAPLASSQAAGKTAEPEPAAPTAWQRIAWVLLPTLASVLFLAVTNEVCQNVATVPLLWIVPLSAYLISFIVAFDHPGWYSRSLFGVASLGVLVAMAGYGDLATHGDAWLDWLFPLADDESWDFWGNWKTQACVYFLGLQLVTIVCHCELAKCKPAPRFLTGYFLTLSLGGALGGILVNLVAPYAFTTYFEFPLALLASLAVVGTCGFLASTARPWRVSLGVAMLVALGLAGKWLIADSLWPQAGATREILARARSFYGTVEVQRRALGDADENYTFYSGHIPHGRQFSNPERRRTPLTYYGTGSGVAQAVEFVQRESPRIHLGVVGLGIGTLASYARPGDRVRFYEINPQVVEIARHREWFTYLSDCRGEVEIVLGDARLQLERELRTGGSQQFDLLCVDAFSGDAIPTHLITSQAFALYQRHLKPQGILALHITNSHLDLYPVVRGAAEQHGFGHVRIYRPKRSSKLLYRNYYVLATNNAAFLAQTAEVLEDIPPDLLEPRQVPLWTDEYHNLVQILR